MATSPARFSLPALVVTVTVVTVELVRSSGPLLDMAFGVGVEAAAGAALATYALPGLLAGSIVALARRRSVTTLVAAGAVGLAVARLVVQALSGWARFGAGLVTVALALAVLTLAVAALAARPGGGKAAARALTYGAGAAVGLQLVLGTWDAYWRPGLLGWVVALALAGALGWGARQVRREAPAIPARPGRLWVLGPALALGVASIANPAFVASQAAVPLAVAGPVTALGLIGAGALIGRLGAAPAHLTAALALPAALALTYLTSGPVTLVVVLIAQVTAALLLAAALRPRPGAFRPGRAAAAASLVGLGVIIPILVFQLDYDVPLGFPNWLIPVAAALAVSLGGGLRKNTEGPGVPEASRAAWLPGAATASLVVAGSLFAVAGAVTTQLSSQEAPGGEGRVTVVSWNLHYGVSPDGDVDLEQIATTIAEQDACVVLLQEVSRGWVQGGGVDMATWLAHRLGMRVEFAPAADRQFGNAILSCSPAEDVRVHELPYGAGPQHRSALSAEVSVAGVTERYTTVHLQHREANTPTRLAQIATLLAAGDVGILGGDFNAEPGWEEITLITDHGLISTQDAVGDPADLTSPSDDPRHRIDWVFVPPRLQDDVRQLVVLDTTASDHRPLVLHLQFP